MEEHETEEYWYELYCSWDQYQLNSHLLGMIRTIVATNLSITERRGRIEELSGIQAHMNTRFIVAHQRTIEMYQASILAIEHVLLDKGFSNTPSE